MSNWDPRDDESFRPRQNDDEDSVDQPTNPESQETDSVSRDGSPAEIDEDTEDVDVADSADTAEMSALQQTEGDVSFAYTAGGKQGDAILRTKRKKRRLYTRIALLFLFPTISIVFLFVVSGPLKLMHVGKLFEKFHMGSNQTSSNSRIGRALEFYRTSGPDGDRSLRNVGFFAGVVSGRMQTNMRASGLDIRYDGPNGRTGRMQSLVIDTNTPEGRRAADGLRAEGFTVPDPDANGRSTVDFRGQSARLRRKALNTTIDVQGKSKVTSAISKRLLRARAGVDFHPLKNIRRDSTERFEDWREKRKKERAERNTNGSDPPSTSISGDSNVDEDGNSSPDQETGDVARDSNDTVREVANADSPSIKKNIASRLGGGAAAVIGILCMLKNDIGDNIPEAQHAARILPAVRTGMELVAVSSQVQAGFSGQADFPSLDEMQLFSELIDGTPLPASATALLSQTALAQGAPSAREIASSKPLLNAESIERQNGVAVGGTPLPAGMDIASDVSDKPALFDIIDGIPVLGTACDVQSGIGSFLKKIPGVGSLVSAAESATASLIDGALGIAGTSMEEIMTGVISWFAKDPLDTETAAGALLGGIADTGVFLAEKEQANASGGAEITNAELAELKQDAWESDQFVRSGKSFFTRMFDIRDTESMLAQAIIKGPSLKVDSTISQNIASLAGSTIGNVTQLSTIFTPKAKAQEPIPYDYGVNPSGFSLSELEAEITADPSANADIIEPQLEALNSRYEGCFGTVIDPNNNFAMRFTESPNYEKISDSKCKEGGETLIRYRFYLLDNVSLRSMACYEGLDEQACTEIGVSGATGGSIAGGSANGIGAGSFVAGVEALNCEGYKRIVGARAQIVNGVPTNEELVPYSAEIKQACETLKAGCIAGSSGPSKALCSAFEFDGTYYGNSYSGSTPTKYGFSIGTVALQNPAGWYAGRTPGLNPSNLLECSGLTAVAVYRAFGYSSAIGCSGSWGERSHPDLFQEVSSGAVGPGDFLTYSFGCASGGSGHIAIAAGNLRSDGNILVYHTSTTGTTAHFKLFGMDKFAGGNHSRWIGPGL